MPYIDPDKIIDYTMDYYAVLGLTRGCLPSGKTHKEKAEISDILLKAMRNKMWSAHPEHGGSYDEFILVSRAQYILGDPILRRCYESGGADKPRFAEEGTGFEIDWDKLGTYRPGTLADTTGYALFVKLCERAGKLGIVPGFHPTDETHSYEWDFALPDQGAKLSLSLVHDEQKMFALTSGEMTKEAMPFKIYWCIPRASLHFLRGEDESYSVGNVKYTFNGSLQAATYSDYNLLETTLLAEAEGYIAEGGKLERDLQAFRDGTLIAKQKDIDKSTRQNVWLPPEGIIDKDTQVLKAILRAKTFRLIPNEHAADFLDDLPKE